MIINACIFSDGAARAFRARARASEALIPEVLHLNRFGQRELRSRQSRFIGDRRAVRRETSAKRPKRTIYVTVSNVRPTVPIVTLIRDRPRLGRQTRKPRIETAAFAFTSSLSSTRARLIRHIFRDLREHIRRGQRSRGC